MFLLVPMVLWLARERAVRKASLPAIGVLALVGLALLPLISAQGGHGTQWIGRWALSSRLQAIPQYYLTGYSGAPLGHGVELLVALPLLAGALLGCWRLLALPVRAGSPHESAWICFSIAAFAVLAPILLAAVGADYLAPRNLVGAMIPLSVLLAILFAAVDGPLGWLLAALGAAGFLAVAVDVDLSPRLQRGNWRDVAHVIERGAAGDRLAVNRGAAALGAGARPSGGVALTTVELGAAPLEYYMSGLHLRNLSRHDAVTVGEIDETGYAPLRAGAESPPAPGFRLRERRNVDGLIVYRFVSSIPRTVSEADLHRHVITLAHPEVLVPSGADVSRLTAGKGSLRLQMSSSDQNI